MTDEKLSAPFIPASLWERDDIQFARLLCEIVAVQEDLNIPALAESMDLTVDEVNQLFDRADAAWERHKTYDAPQKFCVECGREHREGGECPWCNESSGANEWPEGSGG